MRSKSICFSFSVVIIIAAYRRQNCCLLLTGYNSTLCNKSFEEKRDRKDTNGNFIGYRNGLNLNAGVFTESVWTFDVIKARTDKLVKKILEMFKLLCTEPFNEALNFITMSPTF